jgi:isopentenyl-diphosphate delta-isomerase
MVQVILVDEQDGEVGTAEKLSAHREGRLHRAFSVLVVSPQGQLLLQRRHPAKYHSGGLWTNACDGHPLPGEPTADAARRRLREEMGLDCPLEWLFAFTYKVALDHDLMEHEYDHVFLCTSAGEVVPDPAEVAEWAWVSPADLQRRMQERPEEYAVWFRLLLPRALARLGIPGAPVLDGE